MKIKIRQTMNMMIFRLTNFISFPCPGLLLFSVLPSLSSQMISHLSLCQFLFYLCLCLAPCICPCLRSTSCTLPCPCSCSVPCSTPSLCPSPGDSCPALCTSPCPWRVDYSPGTCPCVFAQDCTWNLREIHASLRNSYFQCHGACLEERKSESYTCRPRPPCSAL